MPNLTLSESQRDTLRELTDDPDWDASDRVDAYDLLREIRRQVEAGEED